MALISCPECNGKVSTLAKSCPHCGYPVEEYIKSEARSANQNVQINVNGAEINISDIIAMIPVSGMNSRRVNDAIRELFIDVCCEYGAGEYDVDTFKQKIEDTYLSMAANNGTAPITGLIPAYCIINNATYDLSSILALALDGNSPENRLAGIKAAEKITGLDVIDASRIWNTIVTTGAVPSSYQTRAEQHTVARPKCPTCQSTRLTKLGVGSRAISGAFFGVLSVEGRAQWRCEDCGHMW